MRFPLYGPDGFHPSRLGNYVAALVVEAGCRRLAAQGARRPEALRRPLRDDGEERRLSARGRRDGARRAARAACLAAAEPSTRSRASGMTKPHRPGPRLNRSLPRPPVLTSVAAVLFGVVAPVRGVDITAPETARPPASREPLPGSISFPLPPCLDQSAAVPCQLPVFTLRVGRTSRNCGPGREEEVDVPRRQVLPGRDAVRAPGTDRGRRHPGAGAPREARARCRRRRRAGGRPARR